ncbi:MAG: TIGR02757 family protein [Balneolales bacterium]
MLKTITPQKLQFLKPWLDEIVEQVEQPEYINDDPVSFMHAFSDKEDQLLSGFFAAIMAWGRRDIVIAKVNDLLSRMEYRPAEFIGNFSAKDEAIITGFKHRTFNETDITCMVTILSVILRENGSFEAFWEDCYRDAIQQDRELIAVFHERFFGVTPDMPLRTRKHIANSEKNSSCKRLYLYLRWCVRKNSVVDLGIMDFMPASKLMIPLDVHVARQARKIGLLSRKQNDWKAVKELTEKLSLLEPEDPAKYDYALFGLGVMKLKLPESYLVNKNIQ